MPQERTTTSARTDSSEVDIDGAESEMAKLQRKFRMKEGNRLDCGIQAHERIRRQQQMITRLLKEQEELRQTVDLYKKLSRKRDRENRPKFCALLEQTDKVEGELGKEKQRQKALKTEIANMELKLAEVRKRRARTYDAQRSEAQRVQKAISVLEDKVHRFVTRYNEQQNKNRCLREELQTLHTDRIRFQQERNRLNKELCDIRKKIGELVSLATDAYNARVEIRSKMTMMKEKAEKDLTQYNADMWELERVIAHEDKLKKFMTIKCRERSRQDVGRKMGHKQQLKEQRGRTLREELLNTQKEVLQKIRTATGEEDLDMAIAKFLRIECQNFSLFTFINEQNSEAEALKQEITRTQAAIDQLHKADLQEEQDRCSRLRDIDEQQKKAKSRAEDYENQASIMRKILDKIKTGVNSIVSKLECDRSVIEDTLASSSGISDKNIMSYLGLVEQKIIDLLIIQGFLSSKDSRKEYKPQELVTRLLGQNPELLQQSIDIQPASSSLEFDAEESPVTDEDEQPLSREELRRRIMKSIISK